MDLRHELPGKSGVDCFVPLALAMTHKVVQLSHEQYFDHFGNYSLLLYRDLHGHFHSVNQTTQSERVWIP